MKLLLVSGTDDNYNAIAEHTANLNADIIRYRHVLKAMDNIDEIDPAAIIISARDFPLHWKILVQFIRSERSKEQCPIILLKGDYFSDEESAKAFFLGVNGIVYDSLDQSKDTDQLRTILGAPHKTSTQHQYYVEPWHNIGLLIADLGTTIIIGDVKTISAEGMSFLPQNAHNINIPPGKSIVHTELHECSLRADDAILSPVCRINAAGKTISADFISFPDNEQKILEQYLQTIS